MVLLVKIHVDVAHSGASRSPVFLISSGKTHWSAAPVAVAAAAAVATGGVLQVY